jgi:hypothetical protein
MVYHPDGINATMVKWMFAGPGEKLVQPLGRSVSREVLPVRVGVCPLFITVLLDFDL